MQTWWRSHSSAVLPMRLTAWQMPFERGANWWWRVDRTRLSGSRRLWRIAMPWLWARRRRCGPSCSPMRQRGVCSSSIRANRQRWRIFHARVTSCCPGISLCRMWCRRLAVARSRAPSAACRVSIRVSGRAPSRMCCATCATMIFAAGGSARWCGSGMII
ncbi:MAG: hypothetical protein BWY63_03877 [Chloroflexi bacterium ADurb.Bin360]|nr:MAG: hypothetical protein BWY63_03877 [Chloroflexi bacterium ADurb.Bin360]